MLSFAVALLSIDARSSRSKLVETGPPYGGRQQDQRPQKTARGLYWASKSVSSSHDFQGLGVRVRRIGTIDHRPDKTIHWDQIAPKGGSSGPGNRIGRSGYRHLCVSVSVVCSGALAAGAFAARRWGGGRGDIRRLERGLGGEAWIKSPAGRSSSNMVQIST